MMILLYLILAHLIADFVLQPDKLVRWKQRSWQGVLLHANIHFVVAVVILLPYLSHLELVGALILIAVLHFLIDQAKIQLEQRNKQYVKMFFADQAVHVAILAVVGAWLYTLHFPVITGDSFLIGLYNNVYVVLYGILAIILTYCTEIARFQFRRQNFLQIQFKPDFRAMFGRLLLFGIVYAILVVLSINTPLAHTLNAIS